MPPTCLVNGPSSSPRRFIPRAAPIDQGLDAVEVPFESEVELRGMPGAGAKIPSMSLTREFTLILRVPLDPTASRTATRDGARWHRALRCRERRVLAHGSR
jgi:hypothetical protein